MGCTTNTSRWLEQVDELAMGATSAQPSEQDAYIFAMEQMLRLCPGHLREAKLRADQYDQIYAFVRLGAYADAALALLPERAGVMTSHVGNVMFCASIRLEGQQRETTATASTFALAIVSALALSFVELSLGMAAA